MAQKKIVDLTLRSDFDETCNLPVDDAVQTFRVTGEQILDFVKDSFPHQSMQNEVTNLTLVSSVGSSALTIAVKTLAGTNPSATDFITAAMRSATLTSGAFLLRTLTSALSMVVSSGSTLGQVDGQPSIIYVYLIDNAGTLELAVSHTYYPEDSLVSTTAEGGAGAADSATAIYSTTARTNVAIRQIGQILNTQTTAGTWASAGTKLQLVPAQKSLVPTVQTFTSGTGTYYKPAGCRWIRVRMMGGGGGGGPGTAAPGYTVGATGGTSTFGSSLLTCTGGVGGGGYNEPNGAAGGTATVNSPAIGIGLAGGRSGGIFYNTQAGGLSGAASPFGGAGGAGSATGTTGGLAGAANTGAGGGGGANTGANYPGVGGSAGAFIDAMIPNPSASYAYAVGAGGAGGSGGSTTGGAGGSGVIIVEEFY